MQALKATTGGNDSPTSNADNLHASGALTDDDLKPAFMRRSASDKLHHPDGAGASEEAQLMDVAQARQAGVDMNPRPMARRRLDPATTARKAAATAVLKVKHFHTFVSNCNAACKATLVSRVLSKFVYRLAILGDMRRATNTWHCQAAMACSHQQCMQIIKRAFVHLDTGIVVD